MTAVIVDASALVRALAEDPGDELLRRRLTGLRRLHAAGHVGAEFLSGIRGLTLGGKLSETRAEQAISDFLDLPIARHAVEDVAATVWELRHNLNVYDGAYVALARRLKAPLLTCDDKIRKAAPEDVMVYVHPEPG